MPRLSDNFNGREETRNSLKFLREHPESEEIQKLIKSLEQNKAILDLKILKLTLQNKSTPEYPNIQSEINKRELKKRDFTTMIQQLYRFSDNPDVIEATRHMNEIYSRRKGEEKNFLDKMISHFWESRPVEKKEYVEAETKLVDALNEAEDQHIAQLASTGNPDALLETYTVTLDRYAKLTDKILQLPKKERDLNIDNLITTLTLYESLTNGEYQQAVAKRIAEKAQVIFENQKKSFEGVRGVIQKGTEKGIDIATDFIGGDEGISRILAKSLSETGKELIRPTHLDAATLRSVQEEVIKKIGAISEVIDPDILDAMRVACLDIKANPDNVLTKTDQQKFVDAFRNFIPVAEKVTKKIIATQVELIQFNFPLSRDEKTSEFPADSEGRAKFMQIRGRDLLRLAQLYSPFGIALPQTIEREEKLSPVWIRSAYDTGWFKEHPLLSTGLQGVELAALLRIMPQATKLSLRLGYHLAPIPGKRIAREGLKKVGSIIKKRIGTGVINGPLNIAFAIFTGVEVTNELQEIHIAAVEEEIIRIIEKYPSLRDISPEDGETIRMLTLRNELEKRRGYFQDAGIDLGKSGMGIIDRLALGNIPVGISPRTDMKETGQLREAFLETNRKLVLLGLEPFVIHEGLQNI